MVNVTITVPEELRAEMEKFAEVSWSEICRNAISLYISQRRSPVPRIELSLDGTTLESENFVTGYPTLGINLKIHNKMDSEITVDRIIVNVVSRGNSHVHPLGIGYLLHKSIIGPNSTSSARINLLLLKEKITSLANAFTSSFHCEFRCKFYAEGFKNAYEQELATKIPIDEWKGVVAGVLKTHQTTRVDRQR